MAKNIYTPPTVATVPTPKPADWLKDENVLDVMRAERVNVHCKVEEFDTKWKFYSCALHSTPPDDPNYKKLDAIVDYCFEMRNMYIQLQRLIDTTGKAYKNMQ